MARELSQPEREVVVRRGTGAVVGLERAENQIDDGVGPRPGGRECRRSLRERAAFRGNC